MLRWRDTVPLDLPTYCARRTCARQILGEAVWDLCTVVRPTPDVDGDTVVVLLPGGHAYHPECAPTFPGGGAG